MIPRDWEDLSAAIEAWREPCQQIANNIKSAAAQIPVSSHVGIYYNPDAKEFAVYPHPGSTECDAYACIKVAAEHGPIAEDWLLTDERLGQEPWVKVAYSHTLRQLGEALNFLPGHYPGGIPNHASPLAAMLTTGLIGTGVGYGAGQLGRMLMPEGYGEHLPRSGAIMGGLIGSGLGLPYALSNLASGKSLLDGSALSAKATDPGVTNMSHQEMVDTMNSHGDPHNTPIAESGALPNFGGKGMKGMKGMYKPNSDKFAMDSFNSSYTPQAAPGPFDVHVNALGQVLWESGANTPLSAATMGTMYAASQLPTNRPVPGYVTGEQLGTLAQNAIGDYSKGLAAGFILNKVVGTPYSPSMFGAGSAALGVIGAVIPKLFGQ